MQGSGTFGVEAAVGCAISKNPKNKFLVLANGAYGDRMAKIAKIYSINVIVKKYQDNQVVQVEDVKLLLEENKDVTHVGIIHSETTSGLINPIKEVGELIKSINPEIIYIVDSMSSFAAYDINPITFKIDFLVASSNKNL